MAKAIFNTADGFSAGVARLGRRGEGRGSPAQQVYDGDTVNVEADGNLGVRLLGVDAPEVSFTLPGGGFAPLTDERWRRFLDDSFRDGSPLRADLRRRLERRLGRGCAANHARHAAAARAALRAEVERDLAELGGDRDSFRFFMVFATEVIDAYGRLLCFLNRRQPRGRRPPTYNERLLDGGHVVPYFIWPNIDPFRRQPSLVDAVPRAGRRLEALDDVRGRVRSARAGGLGVWEREDPLRLLPFELRFLGRGERPDRWVIDVAAGDDRLLGPQLYPRIELAEDRLFVPAAYVPLFESKGWRPVRS